MTKYIIYNYNVQILRSFLSTEFYFECKYLKINYRFIKKKLIEYVKIDSRILATFIF